MKASKPDSRLARAAWNAAWGLLFFPSPTPCFAWRRFLLRLFGARVGRGAHVYPSARIWAPWNLEMGDDSCLAPWVDCYDVARINLKERATVSQYSYLCSASHDYRRPSHPMEAKAITIGEGAWVAADVFVGPGVSIGDGAVVGARSSVFKNLPAWSVSWGNPARPVKARKIGKEPS
jgi:putative colanic acid biosynthesis acetyltransferase WcaF